MIETRLVVVIVVLFELETIAIASLILKDIIFSFSFFYSMGHTKYCVVDCEG